MTIGTNFQEELTTPNSSELSPATEVEVVVKKIERCERFFYALILIGGKDKAFIQIEGKSSDRKKLEEGSLIPFENLEKTHFGYNSKEVYSLKK